MNEWWQGLETRERTLVSAMGVMIVVAILYFLILEPLFSGATLYKERVAVAEQDLEYMKRVAPVLKQSSAAPSNTPRGGSNRSLLSIVDVSTKKFDLVPRSSTASGSNKLRVQFDASSFNSMMGWFGELHAQHSVGVDAVNLTRDDDTPGVVSGSVTLAKSVGQ
ncbi:MAG: type II secretion system protein M [Pseudomonadota bacterium]